MPLVPALIAMNAVCSVCAHFIFQNLSLNDLVNVATTSRLCYKQVSSYCLHARRLDWFLRCFFVDNEFDTFYDYMTSGVVISGENSKCFLLHESATLSLTVHLLLPNLPDVAFWMLRIGYTFTPNPLQLPLFPDHATHIKHHLPSYRGLHFNQRTWVFCRGNCSVSFVGADRTVIADVLNSTQWTSCLNIITHSNLYSAFPNSTLNRKLDYFIDQTQHPTAMPCCSRLDPETPLQPEPSLLPSLADVLLPNSELSFQIKRSFTDPRSLIVKINAGPQNGAMWSDLTPTIGSHCWEIIYNVNSMSIIVTPPTQCHSYCITNGSTIDYIAPNYCFNVIQHQNNDVVRDLLHDIIHRHRLTPSTQRDSFDVYSFSQLFHFLNRVQLLHPTGLYITRHHWVTNNDNAVIILTLYVHVILHRGQKSSSLCSLNGELDELLLLRMNIRFTWSYDLV
ncbi:uncharacterized protein C8R40DRAFT_1083702 [Lentinula edodes]|uniref:uncharacterized protein n=1 Tax=Lentinula edodes TaxID=5353 RepID=UPI001E8E1603|nr:uncharacterized protein C8R40DRAFT_1083702 [Lentinula edodes]KAH7879936.1 hypothetical protein C8R40DRAFT_1083702 [Lentinula edodes]